MSSQTVRTEIKNYIQNYYTANAITLKIVEIDGEFIDLDELRSDYNIGPRESWIGIQFLPASEIPYAVASNNTSGHYREEGGFLLHVVSRVKKLNAHQSEILNNGETLRNIFRGATINGDIIIGQVGTVNFDSNLTLNFESGYEGGAVTVDYYRNFSI